MALIEYVVCGEYLLPDIKFSDPPDAPPLGIYAQRRQRYLKEYRPILYAILLLSERLYPLLRDVDEAAAHRLAVITDRGQAEEIINAELIYD